MSKAKPLAPAPVEAPKKKKYEDHEVEGAMSDLMRAEKHKADPHLMKRVHALAGRHMKAIKSIRSVQDLKDIYQDKFGAKEETPDEDKAQD